jgi:hypothetical protein
MDISDLGRFVLIAGVVLVLFGGVLMLGGNIPWLGRLPGDVVIQRDGFTVYFPLASMLVVSVVLTIILNIGARLFR